VEAFRDGQASADRNRHFQRMFEVLMAEWERGAVEDVDVEPFVAFYERVSSAMTRLTASGGNRAVFVFTSGGPIGVCVQRVLEAPRSMALKLNWRVKNCSLTEFVFSSGRISLESFNALPHLTRDEHSFR
jgi:broad specificity phosphatase PhoE